MDIYALALPGIDILSIGASESVLKQRDRNITPTWVTNTFDGAYDEDRPTTPATLPRVFSRARDFSHHTRPSLGTFDSAPPTLKRANSTLCPDRFVAARRPGLNSTISYRSNRDPHTLSKDERLLRHKDATPDAFNPRRRVTSPIPALNPPNPRRVFSANRSGGGRMNEVINFDRQLIRL